MSKSFNKYEDKLQTFIEQNPELIEQYNNIDGVVEFDYITDDLINSYNALKHKQPCADFITSLKTAICYSINNNISLFDSYDLMINKNQLNNEPTGSSIQRYFKEINDIYEKNNNDYDIEYCPENRDKLIEMNLKTVISIAKKYQGLGLSLEELISAGNLGLILAYDKFDPQRSKLKDDALDIINELPENLSYDEIIDTLAPFFSYGSAREKFMEQFKEDEDYDKKDIIDWINKNIKNARFNSIASLWIRAYILIEIDNYSRLVKKPKSEIYKDKQETGVYKKEVTINIDAPVNNDNDTPLIDILQVDGNDNNDIETSDAYNTFKTGLKLLLTGVKTRDRSIFLKKFGIGLPRPMTPHEIALQEGLSIARVSQIFQNVIEQMQKNQVKYNVNPDILFDAVNKIS